MSDIRRTGWQSNAAAFRLWLSNLGVAVGRVIIRGSAGVFILFPIALLIRGILLVPWWHLVFRSELLPIATVTAASGICCFAGWGLLTQKRAGGLLGIAVATLMAIASLYFLPAYLPNQNHVLRATGFLFGGVALSLTLAFPYYFRRTADSDDWLSGGVRSMESPRSDSES